MRLRHRLIAALDVPDVDRAHAIARADRAGRDAIKVNWPRILPTGSAMIRELAVDGYVLCDFKLADIPNTNRLVVEQAIRAGASGIICHGFAGEDSVRACVEAAGGADGFVVTELSHPGADEHTAELAEGFS